MSTEEKKRREEYRKKRNLWILIHSALIVLVSFCLLLFLISYNRVSNDFYLDYTETTQVDYKVYLKDNSFHDEEYLPSNQSYVAELIDYFVVDFDYVLNLAGEEALHNYSYKVEAQLEIISGSNGSSSLLYKHVNAEDPININQENLTIGGSNFLFNKQVKVDYEYYNSKAKSYLNTYKPSNTTSTLIVKFYINTNSSFNAYDVNSTNTTEVSLRIPLAVDTVRPDVRGLAQANQAHQVLASSDVSSKNLFKTLSIVTSILDSVLILGLIVFILLSKNHDINYTNKVNKIVKSYKSFIQKILNMFNIDGYQVLYLETITELLEIRDTLQIPILMYENEDKTCTKFMIPTDGKMLYMFEVKVDNYDEIYNVKEEVNSEEEPITEEEVKPIETLEADNDVIETDESGKIVRYNYSFQSKLMLSSDEYKNFYLQIVNFAKAYGVNVSRSWSRERIYLGRKLFASLQYRGKTLCVAFPLDPKDEAYSKYRFIDMSEVKQYQSYPAVIRVTSARKAKYVIELLEKLFAINKVKNKHLTVDTEEIKTKTKLDLINEGLIKLK